MDITEHLNWFNKMQGHNKVVMEYRDGIHAFGIKLKLWEKQLSESNLTHFPHLEIFT